MLAVIRTDPEEQCQGDSQLEVPRLASSAAHMLLLAAVHERDVLKFEIRHCSRASCKYMARKVPCWQ